LNAASSISVTPAGMMMSVREVHPSNVRAVMRLRLAERVTLVKPVQLIKTWSDDVSSVISPRKVTLSGMTTLGRPEHPKKARLPMVVTVGGRFRLDNLSQF